MQDQYGKSARQKDAHTCSSQELLFSRKYDLESQRKSVNGHYGFSSAFRLFIENLILSHRGHTHNLLTTVTQNLSKTYPKPVQNLSKTCPKASHYTHVSNYFLFSFITLVSISIDIRVQFILFFVSMRRRLRSSELGRHQSGPHTPRS